MTSDPGTGARTGPGDGRAWRSIGWVSAGLAVLALVVGLLDLGPWVLAAPALNFVAFLSLSVTCLAVCLAIKIFRNQARYAAIESEANKAILAKIGESSATAALRAGSAEDNTEEIKRLLNAVQASKTNSPLSPERTADALAAYAEANKGAKQILWVDDNVEWIQMERETLEAAGVATVWAPSTQRALDLLTGNSFSVVVTDMKRSEGEKEGYALLEAMRARGDDTPVIVYSSSCHPDHIAQVVDHGGQGATNDPAELFELVMKELS